LKIGGAA